MSRKKRLASLVHSQIVQPKKDLRFRLGEQRFLILTLFTALVSLLWFRPWDTLITFGDFWLPLNPLNTLRQLTSSWIENISGGQINSIPFHVFPWMAFWGFFKFLGLPLTHIEKLWFVSLSLTASLSLYFLVREVHQTKRGGWANFLAAAIYLFNLYVMMTGVVTTTLLSYSLLPLLLLVYIKGSRAQRNWPWAAFFGLVTIFLTSAAGNPPIYSIPFFVIFLYFVYATFVFPKRRRKLIVFTLQSALFYLLFNAWWLFLFLKGLSAQMTEVRAITSAAVIGGSSPLLDVVRLLGSWAFFAGHKGVAYFPFAKSYLNPVLAALTFVVPLLVWGGFLFWLKRRNSLVIFFGLLGAVGIFLSHGQANDFIGQINREIYKTIPFFWIYREPFAKFTALTALSYSVLLGSLFVVLEERIKSPLVLNLLGFSILTLILTVAWPVVTGDLYPAGRGVLAPARVKVPDYWFEASDWFRGKENEGRVLILPDNPDVNRSGIPYAWGYDSADVTAHLLAVPWIERNNGFYGLPVLSDNLSRVFFRRLHEESPYPTQPGSLYTLLNVTRILQRNDVDLVRIDVRPERYSPEFMKSFLMAQPDLALEQRLGALDIYKIIPEKRAEKISVARKVICLTGDVDRVEFPLEKEGPKQDLVLLTADSLKVRTGHEVSCHDLYLLPLELNREGPRLKSLNFRSQFNMTKTQASQFDAPAPLEEASGRSLRYFGFEVSESGDYKLDFFGDRQTLVDETAPTVFLWDEIGHLVFKKDRNETLGEAKNTLSLGQVSLSAGRYLLGIGHPRFYNLLPDPSFEVAPWLSSLTDGNSVSLSSGAAEGSKSMLLGAGSVDAVAALPPLDPNLSYEISFQYKTSEGEAPTFLLWENPCPGSKPVWRRFDAPSPDRCESSFVLTGALVVAKDWARFQMTYRPSKFAKGVGLGLVFLTADGRVFAGSGRFLVDDFMVRPKFFGGVAASKSRPTLEEFVKPDLTWEKKSTTKYLVKIRNATTDFPLVFSETYDPGWRATVVRGGQELVVDEKNHLVANSFANAWILPGSKDKEMSLIIEYVPERWFRFFALVSVVSVLVAVAFLGKGKLGEVRRRLGGRSAFKVQ